MYKKANILSTPDSYYNFENFGTGTGKSNVVYVSGYSGSGKSTLAKEIAKNNKAHHIELDALHTMKDSDSKHKIVEQYFKDNPSALGNSKIPLPDDYNYKSTKFLPYLRDYVKEHPDEKFVVEGIQTLNSVDPAVPRVVKGTGAIESTRRAIQRNKLQGRKGDMPVLLNAVLYPQIKKEQRFIQDAIRKTDYAKGSMGRLQSVLDNSGRGARRYGVGGLALVGAGTIASKIKEHKEKNMNKSAFEYLDDSFEKVAEKDDKRSLLLGVTGGSLGGLASRDALDYVKSKNVANNFKDLSKSQATQAATMKLGGKLVEKHLDKKMIEVSGKNGINRFGTIPVVFGSFGANVSQKASIVPAAASAINFKKYRDNLKASTHAAGKAKTKGALAALALGGAFMLNKKEKENDVMRKTAFDYLEDSFEKIAKDSEVPYADIIAGAGGAAGAAYFGDKAALNAKAALDANVDYSALKGMTKKSLLGLIAFGEQQEAAKALRSVHSKKALMQGLGAAGLAGLSAAGIKGYMDYTKTAFDYLEESFEKMARELTDAETKDKVEFAVDLLKKSTTNEKGSESAGALGEAILASDKVDKTAFDVMSDFFNK